jgi:AcrR family transcriptional regulator
MGIQQAKIDYIIKVAAELFLERGIAQVTVKDITAVAGVGEATVYRYFATKQNLVMRAATLMAVEIRTSYFDLGVADTGLGKLKAFYDNFLRIYREHPEYYRFIFEFDATHEADGGLDEYEDTLLPYMQQYLAAYELGRADGTVAEIDDVQLFYLTTTHAVMGLCKKLTMGAVVLKQDRFGEQEIAMLIDTILYRLTNLCVYTSQIQQGVEDII